MKLSSVQKTKKIGGLSSSNFSSEQQTSNSRDSQLLSFKPTLSGGKFLRTLKRIFKRNLGKPDENEGVKNAKGHPGEKLIHPAPTEWEKAYTLRCPLSDLYYTSVMSRYQVLNLITPETVNNCLLPLDRLSDILGFKLKKVNRIA